MTDYGHERATINGIALLAASAIVLATFSIYAVQTEGEQAIAIAAGLLSLSFLIFGRDDVTRPHILLPALWFAAVSISQMKILNFEESWSDTTTAIVFGAPLIFGGSSWLAAGHARRPRSSPIVGISATRLRAAAYSCLLIGFVGISVKAQLLGGLPLLADNIDELRSAGGIRIPAYVTFMTDCFFLGSWFAGLAVLYGRGDGRLFDLVIALVGVGGVALSASRNTLLLTLLVPLIFLYQSRQIRMSSARQRIIGLVFVALIVTVVSGMFFLRTGQHANSTFERQFYSQTVARTPAILQPLLPIYVGVAAPFETLSRVVDTPVIFPEGEGTYSMPGIPPQVSPFGIKRDFYEATGQLSSPYYFNVATYLGGFIGDGGLRLAAIASALLGLMYGLLWRTLLRRATLVALCLTAYLAYTVGFMLYENLVGFYTLSIVWDLVVITGVVLFASNRSARDSTATSSAGGLRVDSRGDLKSIGV